MDNNVCLCKKGQKPVQDFDNENLCKKDEDGIFHTYYQTGFEKGAIDSLNEVKERIKQEISNDTWLEESYLYNAGYEKGLYKAQDIIDEYIGGRG